LPIPVSPQACGVAIPFAIVTSACRRIVTIFSAVYRRFAISKSSCTSYY
jgi:hypothetical protein